MALRIRAPPPELLFEVADTGIGIAQEKHGSIFEAFTQADGSVSRRYGGSGLGLAISARLVELMGGRIWLESEPGLGSRFYFTAPVEEATVPGETDPPGTPATENVVAGARPLRVLVAEDSPPNRALIRKLLTKLGHEPFVTANGQEVIEALDRDRFDLVLMDVQMPGMDGLEVTRIIRQRKSDANVPIVALTACAMKGDRERCLDAGMDDYLSKPISFARLSEVLARYQMLSCGEPELERDSEAVDRVR